MQVGVMGAGAVGTFFGAMLARSGVPVAKLPTQERTPAAASNRVRSASKSANRCISSLLAGTGSLYASHASMFANRFGSVAIGNGARSL